LLGKQLFSLYLSRAGVTSMYGSAASVVVVLLWVYYSSLILLFGAEVAHSHAVRSRRLGTDFSASPP
jgi:membrane protein